ncbi:sensor histidine kinase [Neobacillus sp. SCS-31]|uniref:sensor histidine kinase n=1 Tax=Neobacillus oceani TaxID=3115292 RepID=UPI003905E87D
MEVNLLKAFRILAVPIIAAAAALYILNFPIVYSELQQICDTCSMTIRMKEELSSLGWTSNGYGLYLLLLSMFFSIGSVFLGGLIFFKRPNDPMALLVAVTLAVFGLVLTITDSFYEAYPALFIFGRLTSFFATALFGAMICYFPDFKTTPKWSYFLVIPLILLELLRNFLPFPIEDLFWQDWLYHVEWVLLLAMGGTQIYRYRKLSTPLQREQIKLPVMAFLLAVVLIIISVQFPTSLLWGNLVGETLYFAALSLIPLSFFLAIIRYRLWFIKPLINRTILYVSLSMVLLGIYGGVIFVLSSALHVKGSSFISLIGAVAVAVFVQPLHNRLHGVINKLMYGDRHDPYAALVKLGNRLEETSSPELVLNAIVHSVRDALRLPYVSLVWPNGQIAAESGVPLLQLKVVEVIYKGERVADLVYEPSEREDDLPKEDRNILKELARQGGSAIHAIRLTQELQQFRQTLVTTREDERRRLRRDLHDGLGPEIAAFTFKIATARHLLRKDPNEADLILTTLQGDIRNAVDLVRSLVHNLRPPVLDEYGLGGAISEIVRAYESRDLVIKCDIPFALQDLDAAVEVAAYRLIQEGFANIARHSHASEVYLLLSLQNERLIVTIEDNGIGMPSIRRPGVGLTSMRERVEELGGTFSIAGGVKGGTVIRAELPNRNGGEENAAIAGIAGR